MHAASHRIGLLLALVAGILVLIPASMVMAQSPDAAGVQLAQARTKYETEMDSIRARLIKDLSDRETELRGKSDPVLAEIDAIVRQRRAFRESGEWPAVFADSPARQRAARAAAAMVEGYEQARKASIKSTADDLARAVDAEREQFLSQNDLPEWGENLLKLDGREALPLERGGSLEAPGFSVAEYRVEVVAKRTSGEGPLIVEFPLPGGARVSAGAIADSAGRVRAMLSVRKALVSLDLGVIRPVNDAKPVGDSKTKVILRAQEGAFEVLSVRMKPIFAGAPQQLTAREEKKPTARPEKKEKEAAATAVDLISKGSTWRGTMTPERGNGFTIVLKVSQSNAERIVMHGDMPGAGGLEFTFASKGAALALVDVRPTGDRGGAFHDIGGSGSVSKNGMTTSYAWRRDGREWKNRLISGTMSLTRQ